MKPIKLTLLVTTLVCSLVLGLSTAGWGNYYKKGWHVCEDFQSRCNSIKKIPKA